jgi:hypothetical protein
LIIAAVIAARQIGPEVKQETARTEADLKKFNEEQAAAREKQGKHQGFTEGFAQGAGNGAAAALSPLVTATISFVGKEIAGGLLGLIGGTAIAVPVGYLRRRRPAAPPSDALEHPHSLESGS